MVPDKKIYSTAVEKKFQRLWINNERKNTQTRNVIALCELTAEKIKFAIFNFRGVFDDDEKYPDQ